MLQHRSGHMGVFNTRGLERLGVTADTPAPSGGRIGLQDGRLTGYMEENAFLEVQKQVPMPSVEALLDAYRRVQDQYASHGIATVQEGMLPTQLIPLYQALLQAGLLRLDVVGYPDAASAAGGEGGLSGAPPPVQGSVQNRRVQEVPGRLAPGRTAGCAAPTRGAGTIPATAR